MLVSTVMCKVKDTNWPTVNILLPVWRSEIVIVQKLSYDVCTFSNWSQQSEHVVERSEIVIVRKMSWRFYAVIIICTTIVNIAEHSLFEFG